MDACVCVRVCHKETQAHTYTQTDGNTRTNTENSVSHPCRACAHKAANVKGAGGCWQGGFELLRLTNVPSYFQAPMNRWLINLRTEQGLLVGTIMHSERGKVWKREKETETRPVDRFGEILDLTDQRSPFAWAFMFTLAGCWENCWSFEGDMVFSSDDKDRIIKNNLKNYNYQCILCFLKPNSVFANKQWCFQNVTID